MKQACLALLVQFNQQLAGIPVQFLAFFQHFLYLFKIFIHKYDVNLGTNSIFYERKS